MAVTLNPMPAVADATAIAVRLADAEQRLRDALLAGARTADLHAEIASLKAEAARIAAQDAAAKAEAEAQAARAHAIRVTEAADRYATEIARRLESRLAALT